MNNVDFSLINRVRFNGSDVYNLYINGQLVWKKYFDTYYYIGQTLYKNGVKFRVGRLSKTKIEGFDASDTLVSTDILTETSQLSRTEPTNTSGYEVGQSIFVDNKEAIVTGVNGNDITYQIIGGDSGTADGTDNTNITIGGGGAAPGGTTADTDDWNTGDSVYINGRAAVVQGETDSQIFIQYTDDNTFGTIQKSSEGTTLSTEPKTTTYNVGDTIYINGEEAVVTGIAGGVVTYRFVGDNSTGSSDTTTNDGTTSSDPNTSGYDIGDTIYINGTSGTVTGVSGTGLQYTLVNGSTGTIGNTATSTEANSQPNTSGYNVGDIFYIGGVLHTVVAVSGGNVTTTDFTGTTSTFDPTTRTIETEAPNYTPYTLGQTLYLGGTPVIVYKIEGYIITFTNGQYVNEQTATNLSPYAPNTTQYNVGQTLYVDGVAKTVDYFDANKIVFTDGTHIIDGDASLSADPTQVDGTDVGEGDQLYVGTTLKTVDKIEGNTITFTDGTSTTDLTNVNLASDPPNYTVYTVGQEIYVELVKRTIASILGFDITFTDGTNVDVGDNTTSATPPNYTTYTVNQSLWVGSDQKTISAILGHVLTFDDGTSLNSDGATNIYLSKPNFTAFSVDQVIYVGLVAKTITDIIGHALYFDDGTTVNANETTELSATAPNYTPYSANQTLYQDGHAKVVLAILGNTITWQGGGSIVYPQTYLTDVKPVLYGNTTAHIYSGMNLGIEDKATNTEHYVEILKVYNNGTFGINPAIGSTNLISYTSNANHIARKLEANATDLQFGSTIYINGEAKVIEYVSNEWIVTQDNVEISANDKSVSTDPNDTGYNVGDEVFVGDDYEKSIVTAVAGSQIYFEPDLGWPDGVDLSDTTISPTRPLVEKYGAINVTAQMDESMEVTYQWRAEYWTYSTESNDWVWNSISNVLGTLSGYYGNLDTDGAVKQIYSGGKKANGELHGNNNIIYRFTCTTPWHIDNRHECFYFIKSPKINGGAWKKLETLSSSQWTHVGDGLRIRIQESGQFAHMLLFPTADTTDFEFEIRPTSRNAVLQSYVGGQYKNSGYYSDMYGAPQEAWEMKKPLIVGLPSSKRAHVLTGDVNATRSPTLRWTHYTDESFEGTNIRAYDYNDTTIDVSPDGRACAVSHVKRQKNNTYDWYTQFSYMNTPDPYEMHVGDERTNICLTNFYNQTTGPFGVTNQRFRPTAFSLYDMELFQHDYSFIPGDAQAQVRTTKVWTPADHLDDRLTRDDGYRYWAIDQDQYTTGQDRGNIACSDDGKRIVFADRTGVMIFEGDPVTKQYNVMAQWRGFLQPDGTERSSYYSYGGICDISGDGNHIILANELPSATTSGGATLKGAVRIYSYRGGQWVSTDNDYVIHPDDGMAHKRSYDFGHSVSINHNGTRFAVGSDMAQIDVGGFWIYDRSVDGNGNVSVSKYYNRYGSYGDENFGAAVELSGCGHFLAVGAMENELASGAGSWFGRVMFWEDTGSGFTQRWEKRPDSNNVWRLGRREHVNISKDGNIVSVNQHRFPRYVSQAEADKGEFTSEPHNHILIGRVDLWHSNMANVEEVAAGQQFTVAAGQHFILYNDADLANKSLPPLTTTTS
jgi:hypothetical protein